MKAGGANKGPACDNFMQYIPKQSIVLVKDESEYKKRTSSHKKTVKKLSDEPVTIEEMRLRLNISTNHRTNSSASKQNRLGSPMQLKPNCGNRCVVNPSNFGGC